jgi:putative PEP-CTERM system histidine kinase
MIFLQKNASSNIALWGRLATASFCFLPPTWALISLVYARSNYRELLKIRVWYLSLLYGIGLVFFVLVWKVNLFSIPDTFPSDIFIINKFGKYFLIFALLCTVLILINFENTLRLTRIASRKTKKLPLYVLFGAFLFWIYAISQMLLYSRISSQLALIGFIVIIFTNLVLIYNTIKYGLIDLDFNFGREVIYSSSVVFIIGVYLLIIGIVGKIVQLAGGDVNLFLSILAAFIVVCALLGILVSKSLKKRVKLFIDRNFYKNKYDYREQWGQFSESLGAVLNLDELLETLIENITDIFQTRQAAIFLDNQATGYFELKKVKSISGDKGIRFNLHSNFIGWLFRLGEAIEVSSIFKQAESTGLNNVELNYLKTLQAQVCVPMITQQKFMGILFLGAKDDDEKYSVEDFELLETLANHSSIAILNALLNEDLLMSREMESFNKLSSFVLHDLKNSVSMLSMVVQNAEANWDNHEFQKDMLGTISSATERMKLLISKISSLPEKLEFNRRMVQINDLIKRVIKDTKLTKIKNITVEDNLQELPLIALDPDMIKKVFENLVINSLEALPNGGQVKFNTQFIRSNGYSDSKNQRVPLNGDFVVIEIADTGVGMSQEFIQNHLFKPFKTTKKKGLGIGLYHCKEIINAHHGSLEVDSIIDKGTTFKIYLPVLNGDDYVPNIDIIHQEKISFN